MTARASSQERPPVEPAEPPRAVIRLVNPLVRALLRSRFHRLMSREIMLLSFRGRRSGRHYELPVGRHDIDGTLGALTGAAWRANFRGGAPIEVVLDGERRPAHAETIEDRREVVRAHKAVLDRVGLRNARRAGVRINVDREPTLEELEAALEGKAVVRILLDG